MIILDTNVISELMKLEPDANVFSWVDDYEASSIFTTSITKAEIKYGIAILADGKRKSGLKHRAESMFTIDFESRILPFDENTADSFAIILSKRKQKGKPMSIVDAQIAAITKTHNATLATRNEKDFLDCGINVINPWGL